LWASVPLCLPSFATESSRGPVFVTGNPNDAHSEAGRAALAWTARVPERPWTGVKLLRQPLALGETTELPGSTSGSGRTVLDGLGPGPYLVHLFWGE